MDLYSVNFKYGYVYIKNINASLPELIDFAKLKNIALNIQDYDKLFNTEQISDTKLYMPFINNKNVEGDISNLHFVNWVSEINIGACPKLYGSVEAFFDEHINRLNLSTQEGYFYSEANGINFNGVRQNMWLYTISEYGNCEIYSDSERQNLVGTYSKETRQWEYPS